MSLFFFKGFQNPSVILGRLKRNKGGLLLKGCRICFYMCDCKAMLLKAELEHLPRLQNSMVPVFSCLELKLQGMVRTSFIAVQPGLNI